MKRSILAAMVISLALAGCNTSYNYFEDDDEGAPDPGPFNLAHSLMQHSGVVPKQKQRLKYQPRAPIAMPATTELPTPQDGTSTAEAAVNFPVDQAEQDKERRSRLSAFFANDEKRGPGGEDRGAASTGRGMVRLPAEGTEGSERRAGHPDRNRDENPIRSRAQRLKKLNFRGPAQKVLTEDGQATPRKYLIQPPDEYRTPAATAALPEEGDIENSEWIDKQLYRDVKPKSTGVIN